MTIRYGILAMRTIGLIGGMSWESTAVYYRRINEQVRDRLGSLRSAKLLVHSIDFAEIVALQRAGDWEEAARILCRVAKGLEQAGADCILIGTNTMHKLAPAVGRAVTVPLLHIADATGEALVCRKAKKPLLLATRYTMEQDFYVDHLRSCFCIDPLIPGEGDRETVHRIIFEELCCGVIREDSRHIYMNIIERGRSNGADSVILGCTEIGLLLNPADIDLPTVDSTILHADAAVDYALAAV